MKLKIHHITKEELRTFIISDESPRDFIARKKSENMPKPEQEGQ